MADTEGEPQTLEEDQQQQQQQQQQKSHPISKRKPDLECVEGGEEVDKKKLKHEQQQNPDIPTEGNDAEDEDDEDFTEYGPDNENGNKPPVDLKGKGVLTAADKGKGKMIAEEEDGEGGEESDDESSDDGSGDEMAPTGEDESDFEDDPLAEVDLSNILPSRTRRRAPPQPGAYLVTDQDGEDDDDDSE